MEEREVGDAAGSRKPVRAPLLLVSCVRCARLHRASDLLAVDPVCAACEGGA